MSILTADERNKLKDSDFALPGRRYPIHNIDHARNALARVAQFGTPEEKAKVRAAVHKKYPSLAEKSEDPKEEATESKSQEKAEDSAGKHGNQMKPDAAQQKKIQSLYK